MTTKKAASKTAKPKAAPKKAKPKPAAAEAAPAAVQGPWVTSSRHPERGVHQIDPRDFDPRRHKRVAPPKGREKELVPNAGDGSPQLSKQEEAEQAAAAAASAPSTATTTTEEEEPGEG